MDMEKRITFSEFMQSEKYTKYFFDIKKETGIIESNGRINSARLKKIFDLWGGEQCPYTVLYTLIHSGDDVSTAWWYGKQRREGVEELLRQALENHTTWQEMVGYKPPDKNVLL